MGTVPTGQMERELRKLYLQWIAGLSPDDDNLTDKINSFEARSKSLISKLGGHAASLGALADFPAPKLLELSPHVGTIYQAMHQAAIQAGIMTGLNSKDTARQMFNAGMDKSYKRLERLARTETVSAYWKNQWDSTADLPLLVMVWGSEESKRTCDYCTSRDGLVVEDSNIRDHPNGRCTLIPTLRSQVKYKGTLQPDGSVDMDPRWSKTAEITQDMKGLSPEDIRNGTLAAEQQRVTLEKSQWKNKKFNADKGWDATSFKSWQGYTEGSGSHMNIMLRDPKAFAKTDIGADDFFAKKIAGNADDLTTLINKNVLTDDIVVARGVTPYPGFDPKRMKAGDTFADPAFFSTTTNLKEAANFADGRGAGANGWTFITKAPKGTNAIHGADYQHEIIFKPGQPQKILGVDHTTKTIYTEMTGNTSALARTNPRVIKSVAEMDDFGKSMVKPSTLTPKAAQTVDDYAKGTAYTANAVLRGQKTYLGRPIDARTKAYTKGFTKEMDKMMDASIIPEDVRVVRAVQADAFGGIDELKKLVGGIYEDKGYMSTSLAEKVSSKVYDVKDAIDMEIVVPKGSRGLYMAGESYLKSERELLLDRGTKLAVQSVTYDEKAKKWKLIATVVPGPR